MSGQNTQTSIATEDAFRALIRTHGLIRRVMEPFFVQYGISGSQWGILRVLHRAAEEGESSLRATDLGDRLLIRPPSVSGAVDRLQRSGLVVRVASSSDLRAKNLRLTAQGRKLVQQILDKLSAKVQSVLGKLEPAEQVELHRLLGKLVVHLEPIAQHEENAVR
jgi:DNA-binding MarR family transcriptional regulator